MLRSSRIPAGQDCRMRSASEIIRTPQGCAPPGEADRAGRGIIGKGNECNPPPVDFGPGTEFRSRMPR